MQDISLVLVVPCFNEEKRLQAQSFLEFVNPLRQIIFVDDGSFDNTNSILKDLCQKNSCLSLLTLPKNEGKAQAVRAGILYALKNFPEAEWLGFWDADLATPLSEVEKMLTFKEFYKKDVSAIWGSRVYRMGANIQRSIFRHYISRVIVTLMSIILKIKSYDSQCGAKLFHRQCIYEAFGEPFHTRWIFDVEIIKRIKQNIIEYPLQEWKDVKGSKLRFRDGIKVFWDIFVIWKVYDFEKLKLKKPANPKKGLETLLLNNLDFKSLESNSQTAAEKQKH